MTLSSDAGPSVEPSWDPVPAAPLTGLRFLVAALRTATTYVLVSLYVILVGPPGLLIVFLFKRPDALFMLARGGVRLGLALSGIRPHLIGAEHLPRGRAVAFCANHVSNVDPPIFFVVLHKRLRMLFKAEFGKVPILGRAAVMAGFIPVERNNPVQSQAAVDEAAASMRRGQSFLFYPEGTRSRTGELLPFKKGGFIMAIKAQVPLVPVAIAGGRAAMAKGSIVIRPVTVDVRVGQPIETTGMTIDDRDRLVAMARDQIVAMLAQGRPPRG